MSDYEMLLLAGSSLLILAVLIFFSAASTDQPVQKSLVFFIVGAILLYLADGKTANGIYPGDVPDVFVKFIRSFF